MTEADRDRQSIDRAASVAPDYRAWTNPRTGEIRYYVNNLWDILGHKGPHSRETATVWVDAAGEIHVEGKTTRIADTWIEASIHAHPLPGTEN